jgi:hypothetical protein
VGADDADILGHAALELGVRVVEPHRAALPEPFLPARAELERRPAEQDTSVL